MIVVIKLARLLGILRKSARNLIIFITKLIDIMLPSKKDLLPLNIEPSKKLLRQIGYL